MMSRPTMTKWDRRFADATSPNEPAKVLKDNTHLLPPAGRALDLACGLGGNALLLAQHGMQVDAIDASAVALQKLAGFAHEQALAIHTLQLDVERDPLPPQRYDIIVCSHFLFRPLCSQISQRLQTDGLLFYQTFTRNKLTDRGPDSPAYLLQTNELLRLFAQLELVAYREDGRNGDLDRGYRDVACYIGKRVEQNTPTNSAI